MEKSLNLDWLRNNIIGRNTLFPTPYGHRPLVYADYTASGRGVKFIENTMQDLLIFYANTHTDDDYTGETMSALLKDAEIQIKRIVNAGKTGKVIPVGTGATGALQRLATILGVYFPPATRKQLNQLIENHFALKNKNDKKIYCELFEYINTRKPIIFVGPYEHHSNEILWRESLCEVKEIPLNEFGELDLIALEQLISKPEYSDRLKIGSFSAASNVTGVKTPVYDVAKILHKHGCLACFDYAASAPYVEIDMNRCSDSYFDAIVFSPHKFLGGPGASGILIFNEKIYDKNLPPSVAGGGTVCFVTETNERYINDIEIRELAGTPGILQTIRTSLVLQLKEKIGYQKIHDIEQEYLKMFFQRFEKNTNIDIYSPKNPYNRINILPFNIKYQNKYLHPKFVTKLLSELFGIQTRAGCSCAGPYGHKVLSISSEHSHQLTEWMDQTGYYGLKPGWVRINLHYIFSEVELNYIFDAIDFVTQHGHRFLTKYCFNFVSGEWKKNEQTLIENKNCLNINDIISENQKPSLETKTNEINFEKYLVEAQMILKTLPEQAQLSNFGQSLDNFMFFHVENYMNYNSSSAKNKT